MDRSSIARIGFFALAIFLFVQFGLPLINGESGKASEMPPWTAASLIDWTEPPGEKAAERTCEIQGNRFRATLSSRGAALKHVHLEGDKYTRKVDDKDQPIDLATAVEMQSRMALRTNFRAQFAGIDQVKYDDFQWQLKEQGAKHCLFTYSDKRVELTKRIEAGEGAFELTVDVSVKNLDAEAQKHRFSIEQTDWRTAEETAGSLGRASEYLTKAEGRAGDNTERTDTGDYDAGDFDDEEFTGEKWRRIPGAPKWVAVSNTYFSKAVLPLSGATKPAAEARIEEWWSPDKFAEKKKDPNYGHVYRARLAYEPKELKQNESASYKALAYVGPKERAVLAEVGGGKFETTELLDLGMFGVIGKLLVRYLYFLYGLVGTWGWAICLLTITVKIALFPLSITQIKSSYAMRKLKPEMDAINEKYADDAAQRGVAVQELWRKNNVTNPMLGCLPVVFQMPVWFALYQSLQTAVELYHTSFGPWPDLSAPDAYYIIPALLGCSSFLQQRIMPMQGDATQQKMMRWMMPAIFTVMMLFLPAGLGIYFLTNTWLGIGQQLGVERYYRSRDAEAKTSDDDADSDDEDDSKQAFGKGKTRAQQRG